MNMFPATEPDEEELFYFSGHQLMPLFGCLEEFPLVDNLRQYNLTHHFLLGWQAIQRVVIAVDA